MLGWTQMLRAGVVPPTRLSSALDAAVETLQPAANTKEIAVKRTGTI